MSARKQKVIAHHEAGHAVVARVLRIAVPHVAMFSTDGQGLADATTGSASWLASKGDQAAHLRALEDDAKVSLAGPYAQGRHQKLGAVRKHPPEWRDDMRSAMSLMVSAVLLKDDAGFDTTVAHAVTLSPDQREQVSRLFKRIGEETNKLVNDNWLAIERTADRLLQQRIISGEEVDAIIAASADVDARDHATNNPDKALRAACSTSQSIREMTDRELIGAILISATCVTRRVRA